MSDYSDIRYLIDQLTAGSEDAWSFFLRKYGRLIEYCIFKVMGPHSSQEDRGDCYQEILKALIEDNYRRLRQVHSFNEASFRSFIGVLTKRRTLNYIRGIKEPEPLPDEILNMLPDRSEPPDQEALRRELMDIIDRILPDERERLAIHLFWEGSTWDEVGEIMNFPSGTIYPYKDRILSKIKDFLRSYKKRSKDVSFKLEEDNLSQRLS